MCVLSPFPLQICDEILISEMGCPRLVLKLSGMGEEMNRDGLGIPETGGRKGHHTVLFAHMFNMTLIHVRE